MKLTDAQIKKFKGAIHSTWQAIGQDVLDLYPSGRIPKSHIVEMVLDADRVKMFGHLTAQEYQEFAALDYKLRIKLAKECNLGV